MTGDALRPIPGRIRALSASGNRATQPCIDDDAWIDVRVSLPAIYAGAPPSTGNRKRLPLGLG